MTTPSGIAFASSLSAPNTQLGNGTPFFAYVQFVSDEKFSGLECNDIIQSLPNDYPGFLCFIVDSSTLVDEEHPILVVDFAPDSVDIEDYERAPRETPLSDIKTFRAIPSTIQMIENNLSIANSDFADFADDVDADGVFRGGFSP